MRGWKGGGAGGAEGDLGEEAIKVVRGRGEVRVTAHPGSHEM